jgi:hypothetical protein
MLVLIDEFCQKCWHVCRRFLMMYVHFVIDWVLTQCGDLLVACCMRFKGSGALRTGCRYETHENFAAGAVQYEAMGMSSHDLVFEDLHTEY